MSAQPFTLRDELQYELAAVGVRIGHIYWTLFRTGLARQLPSWEGVRMLRGLDIYGPIYGLGDVRDS